MSQKVAYADSTEAYCEFFRDGQTRPEAAMPCVYYQNMGRVAVRWNDGVESSFLLQPGRGWVYQDENGGLVYRDDNPRNGSDLSYRMENGTIFIYFGNAAARVSQQQSKRLTTASPLTLTGIGSVQVGMTVAQAQQAAGVRLEAGPGIGRNPPPGSCRFYRPVDLDGVSFMVINNHVVRVDVHSNQFSTLSGAKVGDSKSRIFQLYPNNIRLTGGNYGRGEILTYLPDDAVYQNYRMIFEVDASGIVRTIRSGRLPEVEYIEGCA